MNKTKMILELKRQDEEIQTLTMNNQTLLAMYDNIRGFKHDFSNFVQALSGYIALNDMNGIKKMIAPVIEEFQMLNYTEFLCHNAVGNPALCSIIANKYILAQEKGIQMNIEINTTCIDREDSICDICRIISILLDNAIEAAYLSKEKIMNLKINREEDNKVIMIVENSYHNKDVDLNQIFKMGFSSKKINSNEHGIGLWNIQKIVMHNPHLKLFTKKDILFVQRLEISI